MTETSTPTRFEKERDASEGGGDRSTDGGVGSPIGAAAEVGRSSGSCVTGRRGVWFPIMMMFNR
ncbi:hypothetical protein HanXRQr2_Chr05g0213161 [Helianthus annuus]|uniref:Uncharacterized protein n=1 Tax=Helianthus annuus TaxID=4232 RepID=A0A251UP60_HELAN|nr:hypothetical protein HanXRQr2_Chr05g0213161 [Helianthus annuus]KAJ0570124.1 hypothetical protein HanHA300_Chr05g0174571 [Helianthus annuus]KAJ0576874.1 hypothetical protein HanIR_Chr05g0229471 [Helianthus annuus]KAJ0584464.1 hypothetical protein HanHA89_Chr05g0188961 [Helianthus annuus]